MSESDRPTFNTLQYLTKVKPHPIRKSPQIIDHFVLETLQEYLNEETLIEFQGYTRSFYTLQGHYANLWLYDRPIVQKPKDRVLDLAIHLASETFKLEKQVTAISWDALKDVPFIPSSSAGWGYVGKKGAPGNHEKAVSRSVYSLNAWLETIRGQSSTPFRFAPDLAWTRTQLGTFEAPKIRHVWGQAFENVILEGITAAPLISAYQKIGAPMPIGIHIYKRLPEIINTTLSQERERRIGVGLDIKSFDTSVQPWLIREAFDIFRKNIIFTDEMSEESFNYTIEHFINRPVVMPDGRMWLKRLGVPSGSYYTQLIDSAVNLIATYYAQLKVYNTTFKTYVLGDDSLFGVPEELTYPDPALFEPHFQKLGFTLSTAKCIVAERAQDLEFLGHVARGTRVDRETAEMLRLALYPEQEVSGPAMSLSRITGILIDSALCSWPIIHLHKAMTNKYRHLRTNETDQFPHESANWLQSVVNITTKPSELDIVRAWTLT